MDRDFEVRVGAVLAKYCAKVNVHAECGAENRRRLLKAVVPYPSPSKNYMAAPNRFAAIGLALQNAIESDLRGSHGK